MKNNLLKFSVVGLTFLLMGAGFKYGGIKHDITVTAKSGATTTLTASSSQVQTFTGTTTQTVDLPSGLTLSNGYWYAINNEGTTGSISVRDASASILSTLNASQSAVFYMKNAAVIGGNWSVHPGAGSGSGGGGSATIGAWQAYTVTFANAPTIDSQTFYWRQVGPDSIDIDGRVDFGGSGTGAAISFSLPSGLTTNSTYPYGGTYQMVGIFGVESSETGNIYTAIVAGSETVFYMGSQGSGGVHAQVNGSSINNTVWQLNIRGLRVTGL